MDTIKKVVIWGHKLHSHTHSYIHNGFYIAFKHLGYDITAFVGIYLEKSSLYDVVSEELKKIPEIIRLNYTTGNYSMFIEVVCKDINQLRFVLHDSLQKIKGIERTETLISLDESFSRNVPVTRLIP
jgi:Lrp/AsnC family transcriptional regulator for asnA, asnC and gidA